MSIEHLDETYRANIRDYLIHRAHAVRIDANLNLLSLAGVSEDFYVEFLNTLLDFKLENANVDEHNVSGIDLIDWENRVAAQVSVTCSPETIRKKIRGSIRKFDKPEDEKWHFYYVPITDQAPELNKDFTLPEGLVFNKDQDVLDITRIMKLAKSKGIDRLRTLSELVDKYGKQEQRLRELRTKLDELLMNTWKSHRSYKLMLTDEIDRRLFPGVRDSHQFEALGKRKDDDTGSPVWSIIRDSWKTPKNRTIAIEGKGGIGKTVTLFSLTDIKHDLIPAPAVYVPMFDLINATGNVINLTEYFQTSDSFASLHPEQRRGICSLAAEKWNRGPRLLVLLDGFNEVPGPRRWEVLHMLKAWHMANQGAQLIAVSRPMDNLSLETTFGDETLSITLSELTKESVAAYLKSLQGGGVRLPGPDDPVWKTIVYPLFLNLYVKADRLRNQRAWMDYPLDIRDAAGPGSIIWNYLQRELLRQENESWILRCAVACEYFAPILAHHMLHRYDYTISRQEALKVIEKAVSEMEPDRMPSHITNIFLWWKEQELSLEPPAFLNKLNWADIVLRETGLLVPYREAQTKKTQKDPEQRFEFLHQNFRDCLAGLYLVNQAEMAAEDEMPEVWKHSISQLALSYAAELMDEDTADRLWNINRFSYPPIHAATYAQLELRSLRSLPYDGLDFSGMDLRGLDLTKYCDKMALFRLPIKSNGTMLDEKCFRSNGHSSSVTCVAWLPNGQCISGSTDTTLCVWDPNTGQCLRTLEGHNGWVNCLAVLPNGLCVSGSEDKTLRVWDLESGKCLQLLEGHHGAVTCVSCLPDGQFISGSKDCTVRIWNPKTEKCVRVLSGHSKAVNCVVAVPAKSNSNLSVRIISGSDDNSIRVWNAESDQVLQVMNCYYHPVKCIAVSNNGRCISGSTDNTLRVWDYNTGDCLKTLVGHSLPINCVTIMSDGRFVSGSDDHTLRIWDPDTGKCLQFLNEQSNVVNCVSASLGGLCVCGYKSGDLHIWNSNSGKYSQTFHRSGTVRCIRIFADGRCVTDTKEGVLRFWDINSGQFSQTAEGHRDLIRCLAVLPDGRIVSGSADYTLRVWDPNTGQCLQTLEGHNGWIRSVTAMPDGRCISGSMDKTLRVWDPNTGQCLCVLKGHTNWINSVAILSDGRCISGANDFTLRVWNPDTGECLKTIIGPASDINCVAPLPNNLFISGSDDGCIRIWNPDDGQCLKSIHAHSSWVRCLEVLSGNKCISGSNDRTLCVWNLSTGECLQVLKGHTDWVRCVAVLSNDRCISGSDDNTLRIWALDTGKCLDVLEAVEVSVSKMDFSQALLSPALSQLLWHNGAKIPKWDDNNAISQPPQK